MEVIRGSGNVLRDLGHPDAELRQAEARTGIAHAHFSHIRNFRLHRLTFDRLSREVEHSVIVTPRPNDDAPAAPYP